MSTCSSILAQKIPWTEEPGGLQSMESVRHDWVSTCTHPYKRRFTHREKVMWGCSREWPEGALLTDWTDVTTSQRMLIAIRSWMPEKAKHWFSLESLEWARPCWCLDVGPLMLNLNSDFWFFRTVRKCTSSLW